MDRSILHALTRRGFQVQIMPLNVSFSMYRLGCPEFPKIRAQFSYWSTSVQRYEWLNVLRGIFSLSFWLGNMTPYDLAYGWYINVARRAVVEASAAAGDAGVVLVGHRPLPPPAPLPRSFDHTRLLRFPLPLYIPPHDHRAHHIRRSVASRS